MYATYKDQIEFLIVYIREAHPEMLRTGNKTGIVGRPKSIDERLILATECVSQYKFTIPMVIDGMEGTVNADYRAAPVRTTIVDQDGKVAYYAGPGPFDFRLSKVERVLKKLVANKGYMPPPPDPVWGKKVEGLRCGISVDPAQLSLGDDAAVLLQFENSSKNSVGFCYNPVEVRKSLVFSNEKGQTLALEPSGSMSMMERMMMSSRRRMRMRPREIAPGEVYATEIEGRISAAAETGGMVVGPFSARLDFEVNEETLSQVRTSGNQPVWEGRLSSGSFALDLVPGRKMSCAACHGDGDYHHEYEEDCTKCHVGEEGREDFGLNNKACSKCHPRDEDKGRLQILGPGGEFDQVSLHISGKIEDKDCVMCHDHSRHQKGLVHLVDPHSKGTKPWTGSETDFCLSCHNGNPPAHLSFPEPKGSGYDKSTFPASAAAMEGKGCTRCHTVHGSMYKSLLRGGDIESPH